MKNAPAPLENIAEERIVLGQILQNENAYWDVAETLRAEHFSLPVHGQIYAAVRDMLNDGKRLQLNLIVARIGPEYADGRSTMTLLTALLRDAKDGDMEGVEVIIDLWKRRKYIEELRRALKEVENPNEHVADLMSDHEARFQDIGQQSQTVPVRSIAKIVESALVKSSAAKDSGKTPGLDTGLPSLDEIMGRVHPGDLGFIGADPGIGKTILAQQMAQHFAFDLGAATLFFQLEMAAEDMGRRYLGGMSGMSTAAVEEGAYDFDQYERLKEAVVRAGNVPLYIDDRGDLTLEQIRDRCVSMKRSRDLKAVFIDHLLKVRANGTFKDRFERTAHVTGRLKALAKQLEIGIVVLVHRTMSTQRASYQPKIQDMDGGGAVQKDADWVIGMARPDLAHEHERPEDQDSSQFRKWAEKAARIRNTAELYSLKGRRVAWGTMRTFHFDGKLSRISEIER